MIDNSDFGDHILQKKARFNVVKENAKRRGILKKIKA